MNENFNKLATIKKETYIIRYFNVNLNSTNGYVFEKYGTAISDVA